MSANLASARQMFGEYSHSPKWHFLEICETRQTRQHSPSHFARTHQTCRHLPNHFARLARLTEIGQNILLGLARLAKCKFGKCYVNLEFGKFGEFGNFGKFGKFSNCRLASFIQI